MRKILVPFVPLYYLVTWLRNWFYDLGVFTSKSYGLPIICVGNLSVGGTGKTPMVEYIVRLLKDQNRLATLSRGYKRKTNGFVIANDNTDFTAIGDEPLQFYTKFKNIVVAVDADRRHGISQLQKKDIETIVLDDAFQHRKVKAGLNILLTTYENPYFSDYVLPTGNLREPRSGAKRAHMIVVTKCPDDITEVIKKEVIKKINPKEHQAVFFSSIRYSDTIMSSEAERSLLSLKDMNFTLVTGIANAKPLVNYLGEKGLSFEHLRFKDHHEFTASEMALIKSKDLVVTTEKDFMRLKEHINTLFYIPIESRIDRTEAFNNGIKKFVREFKRP